MTVDIDIDQYWTEYADADPDSYILVDVREADEYASGHLPNAVNIPLSEFDDHIDDIPDDRAVIMVCQTGGRSAMAGDRLTANGWSDVYNLVGGTTGWTRKGFSLEYPED